MLTGAGFHTEARRHGAWVLCCVVWVFEHNANRCWVSHGGTETRSLGFVAASCGSLSTEPIEAEFHTEARSLGPVLCDGKASVSPWLRVSITSCWSLTIER